MRNKRKIFNDPVYGFINFEFDLIYDIIDHPYFQRLRRISQCGLSNYVYPGANHTRFHHAIGATHLMTLAIRVLREKGTQISEKEALGASLAILLHDIGHGPFSHALEGLFIDRSHEDISLAFMHTLNKDLNGQLDTAIEIFTDQYPKKYLNQLVSSQLDMDRMDYLNRDSYFTGVAEGTIGYDRIIKMLNVSENQLVVEEKGIYSVEKFLMARRLMYGQVYLHKTGLAAEQMLKCFVSNLRRAEENDPSAKSNLVYKKWNGNEISDEFLSEYVKLDDIDILAALKNEVDSTDFAVEYLAKSMLNRNLFCILIQNDPFTCDFIESHRQRICKSLDIKILTIDNMIISGKESTLAYNSKRDEIMILRKTGELVPLSKCSDIGFDTMSREKHYLVYPRV